MDKNYLSVSIEKINQFFQGRIPAKLVFGKTLMFLMFFVFSSGIVSAQLLCNPDSPQPFINSTFGNLSVNDGENGVCLFCSALNSNRLIDNDLTNSATASIPVGVGGSVYFRVTDADTDYAAGTYAGYRIATANLASTGLLNAIVVKTYLNNTLQESATGPALLNLGLLNGLTDSVVGFNTTKKFDAIEISIGSLVGLLNTVSVYYPVIKNYCPASGSALSCNTMTSVSLPTFPVAIEPSHTGLSGVSLGSITNAENVVSSSATDYATINMTLGVLGSASISVKEQIADYPAGTYAGFDISNPSLVSVSALGNIIIATYLNGVQQEQFSGNNLLANAPLLNGNGRYKVGFVTTKSFDEVQITFNQTVGLNLGNTNVYSAVFEKFCAGPNLVCNTQTPLSAPTYPLYINGANTGAEGLVNSGSVSNADNLIDSDPNNYAQINVTAGVGNSVGISVKDQLTDYPAGTFAGYLIESPSLLNVNALDAITIKTYLNGVFQEQRVGNSALISVGTNLLVGTSKQTIGFISTKPFDEVKISSVNTVLVSVATLNVYALVIQKFCMPIVQCNKSYAWVNPDFPVSIDGKLTGVNGVACVGCAVNNVDNLLTADKNDYASISMTAGVVASGSIAVADQIFTYPVGTFAGFTIKNVNNLIELDLFNTITISTYLDGVFRESKTGGQLLSLQLLTPLFVSGSDIYNVGFNASKTFDEIRITLNPLIGAVNNINVYGAFVNTSNTSGGSLSCMVIDAVDDTNSNPVYGAAGGNTGINVFANDTANGAAIDPAVVVLTSTPTGPLTVNPDGSVTVAPNTPAGTYTVNYTICDAKNLANCDTATVTVVVSKTPIVANDDLGTPVNGFAGGVAFTNVLTNDTLNGNPVNPSQITTSFVSSTNSGITLSGTDVVVAAGTPAGTYSLIYQICENLNPTNCDSGTVTVTVTAPVIVANDDTGTPINGFVGGVASTNVLANDTLNGNPVNPSQITTSFVSSTNTGVTLSGTDVVVAAGTPAGTYSLTYQICEKLNPTNCDTGTVTVTVTASAILANDDSTSVNGYAGGTAPVNVLTNDTLNGNPVNLSDIILTPVSNGPLTVNPNGSVTVAPNTPAGTYTVNYTICEKLNPLNCDSATVTVTVTTPAILANDDIGKTIDGTIGGTTYTNVLSNDTLNGVVVVPSQVTTTFVSSTNAGITLNGTDVVVAASTPPGTYSLVYQICENLNPTNCDTATVSVTVSSSAPTIVANNDTGIPVNGYIGGPAFSNVLGNDTLNGGQADSLNVNTSFVSSTNPGITLSGTNVLVAAGTPAGTYSLDYQICEIANSTNCDVARVSVVVSAPIILANDDSASVNGYIGGTPSINVLTNDSLNGNSPVNLTEVTLTSAPNGPLTVNSNGSVTVASNTPAGTYTVNYTICEKLNPSNCDSGTVTINVTAPVILANDDSVSVNGYTGATASVNVLDNDTLNGNPVNPSQITTSFVSSTNSGITLSGADVVVAAGTPAGTYSLIYQICEKLNPLNCDLGTVTITVTAPVILANDDSASVNGYTGGTTAVNVLTNDTLNGNSPVSLTEVTLTSVPNGPLTVNPAGTVTVAPNTPAGTYTVNYTICEKLNPLNCDLGTVTITVTAPVILANDDSAYVNGYTGGTASVNVLTNDSLNGNSPVSLTEVTLTSAPNGPLTINPDGSLTVAPNTPVGTYTVNYTICEKLNPSNCATATVTITVTAPVILANDDSASVNGQTGGTALVNVLTNDSLNGNSPVSLTEVTLTSVPNGPLTINPDGSVTVAANTPAGTYLVNYTICEKLNPSNCDPATVTVTVTAGLIDAVNDVFSSASGNSNAGNVLANDTLNGLALGISDVNLTEEVSATSFVIGSPVPSIDVTTGIVSIPLGTPAGNYTITYKICEKLNPTNCDSATLTVTVLLSKIALVKSGAVNGTGKAGDTITYTFQVTNTGSTTLNNVFVNDALTNSVNLSVMPSVLAPNQTGIATVVYVITQADADNGKVTNSATVISKDPSNNDVTDISGTTITTDDATVTILTPDSKIALVKTGKVNGAAKAGNTITYTFTVVNTGNTTLSNIFVNDPYIGVANLALIPSVLVPGQTGVVTADYVIKQSDIDAKQVDNTAIVTSKDPGGNIITDTSGTSVSTDDHTITTLIQNPLISITKDGVYEDTNNDGIANVGDNVKYSFVVTNIGEMTLTNVVVTDNNAQVSGGPLAVLNVGQSDSVTFTAVHLITQADVEAGYVYNMASVSAQTMNGENVTANSSDVTPCPDCPVDPNCPSCTITVIPQSPSIALIKTGKFDDNNGNGIPEMGETITYSFQVTNTGNCSLKNITITDLKEGVVMTGSPIDLGIGASDTTTFKGVYTLTVGDLKDGVVYNQALAKGTSPLGVEVSDMSDSTSNIGDEETSVVLGDCVIIPFNAVSPDADGKNDFFRIVGIECFPNNTVIVYNRWGVKVFEQQSYNNTTAYFDGLSSGRATVDSSDGLPSGTYFYTIKYTDELGKTADKSGYLMLSKE